MNLPVYTVLRLDVSNVNFSNNRTGHYYTKLDWNVLYTENDWHVGWFEILYPNSGFNVPT